MIEKIKEKIKETKYEFYSSGACGSRESKRCLAAEVGGDVFFFTRKPGIWNGGLINHSEKRETICQWADVFKPIDTAGLEKVIEFDKEGEFFESLLSPTFGKGIAIKGNINEIAI